MQPPSAAPAAAPTERKQQLQMIWPPVGRAAPIVGRLPTGYALRTWRDGDAAAYIALMNRAGFEGWSEEQLKQELAMCLPRGLFFVVHAASGTLVATACANHRPSSRHPFGGELGWVASDPDHRGHGLGRAATQAATVRLLEAGYTELYLQTDDFRLAAIHVYLQMGWLPWLYLPDMQPRWRAVCEQLGVPFEQANAVTPAVP
jgi:mycothiol synthase